VDAIVNAVVGDRLAVGREPCVAVKVGRRWERAAWRQWVCRALASG
jgi:hypothetical protein